MHRTASLPVARNPSSLPLFTLTPRAGLACPPDGLACPPDAFWLLLERFTSMESWRACWVAGSILSSTPFSVNDSACSSLVERICEEMITLH